MSKQMHKLDLRKIARSRSGLDRAKVVLSEGGGAITTPKVAKPFPVGQSRSGDGGIARNSIITRRGLYTWLALAIVLLGITTARVSSLRIDGYELSLFRFINNWSENWRQVFLIITFFGGAWLFVMAALLSLWKKQYDLATRIIVFGATSFLITELLKRLIARSRPVELLTNIHLREIFASGYGFPSGHTAVATTVSLLLLPLLSPRWRWACLVWIFLVGLSRIYLGVHAPLDVLGGFAVGIAVVCAGELATQKLMTKITH